MSDRKRYRKRSAVRAVEPAAAGALGKAVLALGAGASLAGAAAGRGRSAQVIHGPELGERVGDARSLYAAAGLLALSVLADSALEHYRGSYRNPGMYTPLVVSAATLAAAIENARATERPRGGLVFAAAAGVGAAGLGFHVFDIAKRPGRFNWINLFYAAPLGAPAALTLAGLAGFAARAVANGRRKILGLSVGRALAGLFSLGLFGTVGEAALLHFRGAFQNPFMWLPVSLPPVGAALLGRAACERKAPPARPFARAWLALTALLGIAGVGFHIFGVSRAMGGWRNWRQNLVDGPPIPAPPAFSALALGGVAALRLRDRDALT